MTIMRTGTTTTGIKTYSELITIPTFIERFEYLSIGGEVGRKTFGDDRYLNQILYNSYEWRNFRRDIIVRDHGTDLAMMDEAFEIEGVIIVHHINPITVEDVLNRDPKIFDPENVVSTSRNTHNAVHYGDMSMIQVEVVERKPFDTCPWRL